MTAPVALPAPSRAEFRMKQYVVSVEGFGCHVFDAVSPGRARAHAYQSSAFNGWTFKEFLRRCRLWRSPAAAHPNYGREITVGGERAYYVGGDSQYIRFVRPGADYLLNAHPLDVEPDELRPFHYRKGAQTLKESEGL